MAQDLVHLALQGSEMSDAEAKRLEQHLQSHPNDAEARARLIGYYSGRRFDSHQAREARQKHVMWFIQHRPDDPFVGTGICDMHPDIDGEAYHRARALWLQHVAKHPKSVQILANACSFLTLNDRPKAIELAKRIQSLQPHDPQHALRLAHLYMLDAQGVWGKRSRYLDAVRVLEAALPDAKRADDRIPLLRELANAAQRANMLPKAERYARELLHLASTRPQPDADGIHIAHTVLGKVALHRGDIEAAKKHLLDSARVSGSPVLSSFGPDFTLAKVLLQRGERQAVIEYLNLCERFWKSGKGKLPEYRRTIEGGGIPDFGFRGE
ncbi:MAG: hypothetical protein KatS3mg022_3455 [Armatimonadota bacterium]|nr:MAG: hypothetical protein KatS3mg022_3455 [Armatimonadota bacterium]